MSALRAPKDQHDFSGSKRDASSQDVDSNEVSVDHAKGVMNFIDETA